MTLTPKYVTGMYINIRGTDSTDYVGVYEIK